MAEEWKIPDRTVEEGRKLIEIVSTENKIGEELRALGNTELDKRLRAHNDYFNPQGSRFNPINVLKLLRGPPKILEGNYNPSEVFEIACEVQEETWLAPEEPTEETRIRKEYQRTRN